MDWNVFDFDHDGQTESYEVGIGASLIGSAGYGAGLSEADSRERRLREEYDEELKRKQDRIDELEGELEELRSSCDDDDEDDDDEHDGYDDNDYGYDGGSYGSLYGSRVEYVDNFDDDLYDFVSNYAGTEYVASTPSRQDLEYLQNLKDHLEDESCSALMTDGDCRECAFWVPGETHHTRGWCCQLWSWCQIQYGGGLQDEDPAKDNKVCPKYQDGTGTPVTCYDCKNWDQEQFVAERRKGCKHWEELSSEIEDLRRGLKREYGHIVEYAPFSSAFPFEDKSVCFDFQLDTSLDGEYGIRKAELVKASAECAEEY